MFERKRNFLSKIGSIILNISIVLIIVSMVLLVINQFKVNQELQIKNKELLDKNKEIGILLSEQLVKSHLLDTISAYTEAINNNDLSRTLSFYADSLDRFFLNEMVDIKFVEKSLSSFFEKNKRIKILLNTKSITYNIQKDTMTVSIKKDYLENNGEKKTILTEMRFNKNYKIIYIRDYYTEK